MKTELSLWEPMNEENQGILRTSEAKSLLLFEYGRQVYRSSRGNVFTKESSFPEAETEVVSKAIQRGLSDNNTHPIAFLLASQYGRLEELVGEIKVEETKGYDNYYGYSLDKEFDRKMSLVNHVLIPLRRYEEAKEQLVMAGKYHDAVEVASQISPLCVVELCEEIQDLFKLGLKKIEGQNVILERRIKISHVQSYVDGTNRETQDRINRWREALEKAQGYNLSGEEIEKIKRKALDSMIGGLETTLESGKPITSDEENVVAWASNYIGNLVFDDERFQYRARLLGLLGERGANERAMRTAVELEVYDTALSEAKLALNSLGEKDRKKEEIERFVESEVLEKLDDADAVKGYIGDIKLLSVQASNGLAKRFRLERWLSEEYERRGFYEQAAYVAESSRDNVRAKQLYKMAGSYGRAFRLSQDIGEQVELCLNEGESQLRTLDMTSYDADRKVLSSIDWLRRAIDTSKGESDLKVAIETAISAVDVLVNQGFYREVVLFGSELGMDKIGSRLPADAIVPYERSLDFASCALISNAQGKERDARLYLQLASYFDQKVPQKLVDLRE